MKEFILIRHGQTDYNRDHKFFGMTDIALNNTGKKQVRRLRKELKSENVECVYVSDLQRCRETAKAIGFSKSPVFSGKLREMSFGDWEGLDYKQIMSDFAKEWQEWRDNWVNFTVPGGESFQQMSDRVIGMFETIKASVENTAALVTHGGCIRALLAHYLNSNLIDCFRYVVDNASVSRLCFHNDYAYLKSLNQTWL